MIELERTVILVDGQTEIRAFKARFYKEYSAAPQFRKVGCNGKSVTPEGYAAAAFGILMAVLRERYTNIVCVIDREQRTQSSEVLRDNIRKAIIEKVVTSRIFHKADIESKLKVCVPDRMFENWIVSDIEGIKSCSDLIKESCIQRDYEGKNGVRELKNIMKVPYKKMLHAKRMFCAVRNIIGCANSYSYNVFCNICDVE